MRSFSIQIQDSEGFNSINPTIKYVIRLSRNNSFYFNNLRDAKCFRVKLEEFYTNHCYLINDLYLTTLQNYRHYFFNIKPFEIKFCKEYFKEIDTQFDYILSHSETTNSNNFKFSRFQTLYDNMSSINAFLSNQARIKKDYSMKNKCKSFEMHLFHLKDETEKYNIKYKNLYSNESTLQVIKHQASA